MKKNLFGFKEIQNDKDKDKEQRPKKLKNDFILIKNISKPYYEDHSYFPKTEMIKIKEKNYNLYNLSKERLENDELLKNQMIITRVEDDIRDITPMTGFIKENGHLINKQHFDNEYMGKDFDEIVKGDKAKVNDNLNKRMNRIRTEFDYPSIWNYHDIYSNKPAKPMNLNLIKNLDPNLAFREDPFKRILEEKMKKEDMLNNQDIKSIYLTIPIEVNKPMAPIKTFEINNYDSLLKGKDKEHETIKNLELLNKDYIKVKYKNIL